MELLCAAFNFRESYTDYSRTESSLPAVTAITKKGTLIDWFFSYTVRFTVRARAYIKPCRVFSIKFWSSFTRRCYPLNSQLLNHQQIPISQKYHTHMWNLRLLCVDESLFMRSQQEQTWLHRSAASRFTSVPMLVFRYLDYTHDFRRFISPPSCEGREEMLTMAIFFHYTRTATMEIHQCLTQKN